MRVEELPPSSQLGQTSAAEAGCVASLSSICLRAYMFSLKESVGYLRSSLPHSKSYVCQQIFRASGLKVFIYHSKEKKEFYKLLEVTGILSLSSAFSSSVFLSHKAYFNPHFVQ